MDMFYPQEKNLFTMKKIKTKKALFLAEAQRSQK